MKRSSFFLFACLVCFAGQLVAQYPERGPDGGTSTHVSGVVVLPVPGKPFSANTSTEWTRTLPDGSTITTHLTARMARDKFGRIYRENHNFVPANSDRKSPTYEIHIYDPTSHSQAFCRPRLLACVITDYVPQTFFETLPAGTSEDGSRTLVRELLGQDTIEGIYVTGTRETVTIRPGTVGNEQPLVSTREFWYSDDLKTNLAVTRLDPREGKQVIRLSDINAVEPDRHLFELPIGYSVRDQRTMDLRSHAFGEVFTRQAK
jgi:hypothetical protein